MFMLDGKLLPIDTSFQHNGTSFPANWLRLTSLEEKQAIGITEVADPEPYDDRFYWNATTPKLLNNREESDEKGNPLYVKVLGTVNGKPAMVDSTERLVTKGLKSQWVAQVKDTANKLLAQTDWMIIRKAERNVDVPAETIAYRQGVIAECSRLVTAIEACEDVPALIAVISAQNWPQQ